MILSNLHKYKKVSTENETYIIILTFVSNWHVKDIIVHHYIVAQCQAMSDVPTAIDF